ncbi:hypothetical protein, partial [Candidatus Villigracilis saccharophilus]|uniref:hypothetical protein n=1 Tax=Candidatus Villigracilis saccharophilus TaxID=3140684 RepID=UPI0031370A07|nr:hypothetical protein [Anaerolineales bacterium]
VIFTDIPGRLLGSGLNIPSTRELADVSGLDVIASVVNKPLIDRSKGCCWLGWLYYRQGVV